MQYSSSLEYYFLTSYDSDAVTGKVKGDKRKGGGGGVQLLVSLGNSYISGPPYRVPLLTLKYLFLPLTSVMCNCTVVR